MPGPCKPLACSAVFILYTLLVGCQRLHHLALLSRRAENGHGSGGGLGGEGGAGELSDAQLSSLLPSLKQPDYYTEPSLQQLAAMARDDPASLASVANFTVGRRGVGSVRWLEPSDARGLDLDATVQLSKGSIEVGGRVGGWVGGRWVGGRLLAEWAGWPADLLLMQHVVPHIPPACLYSPPIVSALLFALLAFFLPLQVYLDESQKPEVGRGLNRPAEVTMLRIHKLDKDSGRPTQDPEAIDR